MDKNVDYVVKLFNDSKNYYRQRWDDHVKYYKQYRSWLDQDSMKDYYKWRSRLFMPATARAVDGLLPDLILTLFGASPWFEQKPREGEDVVQAGINQEILDYQFDVDGFFFKYFIFLKQMAFYGISFGKVFPCKDEVDQEDSEVRDELTGKMIKVPNPKIVLRDGNTFKPQDNFAIYYSPRATDLSDTWIIQRAEKTLGEMKKLGVYQNISELESMLESSKDTTQYQDEIRKAQQGLPSRYSGDEGDERKIELLEYWNADRTKTMTVAGGMIPAREMRPNPLGAGFDPFVIQTLWPNPFEIQGVGIPEKVRDIQDQLNCEVNQRLDNRNIRQNLILKVRKGAGVNTRNLVSRPGAVWLTDDMTAIQEVNFPDTSTASSFMEENMLEGKCEEITGITKYVTGGGVDSRRTATESSILQRMGSKQFALHVALIEEMSLKPIIRKFHILNQKFMTREQVERIVGIKGAMWKPSSYQDSIREYDIKTVASSQLTDKNLKVQQMIQYLQIIGPDPTMQNMKREITKRIWEAWGYKDFDLINQLNPAQINNPSPMSPSPPQTMGGRPVEPTGLRMPSPMEGVAPMPMGGGGIQMGGG